jgi:hypothetical protein
MRKVGAGSRVERDALRHGRTRLVDRFDCGGAPRRRRRTTLSPARASELLADAMKELEISCVIELTRVAAALGAERT